MVIKSLVWFGLVWFGLVQGGPEKTHTFYFVIISRNVAAPESEVVAILNRTYLVELCLVLIERKQSCGFQCISIIFDWIDIPESEHS